jgi:hypothetical protein
METQANKNRKPAPDYKPEDLVWLDGRNIKTQRPSRKLDDKNIGPCKVLEKVGSTSFKLKLPEGLEKLHPVFHSSLLRWHRDDPLPGQINDPPPPIMIDDQDEYEVEEILDSRAHYGRLQYKAKWKGYPPSRQWWNADGFDNAKDLVQAFHNKYPKKAKPEDLVINRTKLQERQQQEELATTRALQRRRHELTDSIQKRQAEAGEPRQRYNTRSEARR